MRERGKRLEYFTVPKHLQIVKDVDELGVARAACDGVKWNEDKAAVRVLFLEGFKTFLMFGLYVLGGFDFDGHLASPITASTSFLSYVCQ